MNNNLEIFIIFCLCIVFCFEFANHRLRCLLVLAGSTAQYHNHRIAIYLLLSREVEYAFTWSSESLGSSERASCCSSSPPATKFPLDIGTETYILRMYFGCIHTVGYILYLYVTGKNFEYLLLYIHHDLRN